MVRRKLMDPVPIGGEVVDVMKNVDNIERILKNRQEATAMWKTAWEEGTLPQTILPCHGACNGVIILTKEGRQSKGQCPAHMQEGVCPLVGKAEKELRERLERAGFAPRYHTPDPARIPAREVVEEYLRELGPNLKAGRGLILTGDVGVGKTFAMAYMARRMLVEHVGVWKTHMSELIGLLNDQQQRKTTLERCLKVQVLMLDDWGTAQAPPWVLDILDGMVESRNGRMAPFIVSTNLKPEAMKKDPETRRIVDRWGESTGLIRMGDKGQRGAR
jgi:DNA replication protein DnaC